MGSCETNTGTVDWSLCPPCCGFNGLVPLNLVNVYRFSVIPEPCYSRLLHRCSYRSRPRHAFVPAR